MKAIDIPGESSMFEIESGEVSSEAGVSFKSLTDVEESKQ